MRAELLHYLRKKKDESVTKQMLSEGYLAKNRYSNVPDKTRHARIITRSRIENEVYTDLLKRIRKGEFE